MFASVTFRNQACRSCAGWCQRDAIGKGYSTRSTGVQERMTMHDGDGGEEEAGMKGEAQEDDGG